MKQHKSCQPFKNGSETNETYKIFAIGSFLENNESLIASFLEELIEEFGLYCVKLTGESTEERVQQDEIFDSIKHELSPPERKLYETRFNFLTMDGSFKLRVFLFEKFNTETENSTFSPVIEYNMQFRAIPANKLITKQDLLHILREVLLRFNLLPYSPSTKVPELKTKTPNLLETFNNPEESPMPLGKDQKAWKLIKRTLPDGTVRSGRYPLTEKKEEIIHIDVAVERLVPAMHNGARIQAILDIKVRHAAGKEEWTDQMITRRFEGFERRPSHGPPSLSLHAEWSETPGLAVDITALINYRLLEVAVRVLNEKNGVGSKQRLETERNKIMAEFDLCDRHIESEGIWAH